MFWDRVAPVYGIFVKIINGKAHRALKRMVADAMKSIGDMAESISDYMGW